MNATAKTYGIVFVYADGTQDHEAVETMEQVMHRIRQAVEIDQGRRRAKAVQGKWMASFVIVGPDGNVAQCYSNGNTSPAGGKQIQRWYAAEKQTA